MFISDPIKIADTWRKLGIHIGENTYVYRSTYFSGAGKEPITVGNNCVLTACSLIAHDASTNRQLGIEAGQPSPTAPIVIEDGCFIGYHAIILMGVTIGKGSIVGAGAVVTKSVPPNSVVVGNPAHVICSVDELVMKRMQSSDFRPFIPKERQTR